MLAKEDNNLVSTLKCDVCGESSPIMYATIELQTYYHDLKHLNERFELCEVCSQEASRFVGELKQLAARRDEQHVRYRQGANLQ